MAKQGLHPSRVWLLDSSQRNRSRYSCKKLIILDTYSTQMTLTRFLKRSSIARSLVFIVPAFWA
ncbi:MAG: hypothetical protein ACJAR1_000101 [Rubritalea sp.]|jgi:hypothetical protein